MHCQCRLGERARDATSTLRYPRFPTSTVYYPMPYRYEKSQGDNNNDNKMAMRDKDSLRFVHCLSHRDLAVRSQAFDVMTQTIDAWIGGYGSPSNNQVNENLTNTGFDPRLQVKEYLVDFLRLSYQCPFDDIREKCKQLLLNLKKGYQIIYSKFKFKIHMRQYISGEVTSLPIIRLRGTYKEKGKAFFLIGIVEYMGYNRAVISSPDIFALIKEKKEFSAKWLQLRNKTY
ncbi:hypothetical protein KUTeg_007751 [Tegillarca granosa]|uniref:Uncharacterized protein n=1 Tax=Tegillarca granosa TaxID=220873 RepID=A0ABQ9FG37_TEGGR|nr:hypothetical protein KUTeg_007751 [Tegillarca granosa]